MRPAITRRTIIPFVTPHDVEIHYETHGERGETFVLVHGYTGDITDWRHQIAAFASSYRLLVLDNRGHGRSAAPADAAAFAVPRMADDVEAVAAHVGSERYHLLGHSMGGAVAQEIALRSPAKLLSLVLEDTSFWFGDHRPGASPGPPPLTPERLEEIYARLSRMTPETLRAAWKALLGWQGTAARAAAIRLPTLIVHGERDAPAIIAGSQRLAALISGSDLRVIAGAAHSPQEEQPAEFNAILGDFLARHRAGAA